MQSTKRSAQEMERDSSVIVMGLDNAGGRGTEGKQDAWGGVLGVTKGLYGKFGDRVMDTPISEIVIHRCRGRRCRLRDASGCRDDVRGLSGSLFRPVDEPGCQVPLHVRRQGGDAGGDAYHVTAVVSGPRPSTPRCCTTFLPTSPG